MSSVKTGRLFSVLCVLGTLANATHGAEPPTQKPTSTVTATVREYSFGLHTLNQSDTVRRGSVRFNIDAGMTEEELDSVNHLLDALGASRVDEEGYRSLSMSNGTRVRIGGFLTEGYLEDSVEGVHSLPIELAVNNEFSTPEAALVLQLARAGHLFIGSSIDADRVATVSKVTDRRFQKRHESVSITADEGALAQWVQQNIPARDAADEDRTQP